MHLAMSRDGTALRVDGRRVVALKDLGFAADLMALIQAGPAVWRRLETAVGPAREASPNEPFGPPLRRPGKIVAVGHNYRAHVVELHSDLPPEPLVFAKFPTAVIGPGDPIRVPRALTREPDYEAELGVIIGRRARNVSREEALEYVFGYTVLNDVSARDLQYGDKQWVRSKSLDTFCPLGPVIVTAAEIPDPQTLGIGCRVNGERRQKATTAEMIFPVADLIAHLARAFTLEPGDLIATGTPAGVGKGRKPPVFLHDGDVVECWVEGIGTLTNPVLDE